LASFTLVLFHSDLPVKIIVAVKMQNCISFACGRKTKNRNQCDYMERKIWGNVTA
jgi:hypothetical protein